jgi:hypothetical protein
MRWLTVLAAGFFAATAILALVYGQNAVDHWQSHREVVLGEIKALENDPGYPSRDANLRSAREQAEILDRIALKKSLISAIVLVLAVAAFVPLWRRASRTFTRTRLIVFVALGAAVSVAVPVLIFVMLAAGTIRG